MAFRYEVVLEMALAELFRERFLQVLKESHCCEIFRLVTPDIPNIWEFKRGKDIFTLEFTEEEGDQEERIIIQSDKLDLTDIIISAVQAGLANYLLKVLSPLAQIPQAELESRINAHLAGLQSDILK